MEQRAVLASTGEGFIENMAFELRLVERQLDLDMLECRERMGVSNFP